MFLKKKKVVQRDLSGLYLDCVKGIIEHETVKSMKQYNQHGAVDCFKHSLHVSISSFLICRRLGLDYRSAARGGLLHDFFLYDWHKENPHGGLHGLKHPKIAAMNANKHFSLNNREKDVIKKHMWPLTLSLPRYPETLVVLCVDKYFCIVEAIAGGGTKTVRNIFDLAY